MPITQSREDERKQEKALMLLVGQDYAAAIAPFQREIALLQRDIALLHEPNGQWRHEAVIRLRSMLDRGLLALHDAAEKSSKHILAAQAIAAVAGATFAGRALYAGGAVAGSVNIPIDSERLAGERPDGTALFRRLQHDNAEVIAALTTLLLSGIHDPASRLRDAQAHIDHFARRRIPYLAQNEYTRVYNRAMALTYEDNADIAGYWRWTCMMLPTSCAACIYLDGQVFPVSQPFNQAHNNCMCEATPVFAGDAATDGRGQDWFTAQTPAIQRGILGRAMYSLFDQNIVKLSDIITRPQTAWGQGALVKSLETLLREGKLTPQQVTDAYRVARMRT
jgi:hypothetical protein